MSVMSVESPDRRSVTPHTHSATHSPNRTDLGEQDNDEEEPEMANDSKTLHLNKFIYYNRYLYSYPNMCECFFFRCLLDLMEFIFCILYILYVFK